MAEEALLIRGLEKRFDRFTLGPLDLTVPRGAIYGFVGRNGTGKSTTLDLIMGMGRKDAGRIEIFGLEHEAHEAETKRQIGFFSPDTSFASWGRVDRLVNFFRGFYDTWDDDYCLGLIDRWKLGWHAPIAALSFGERTKLGLVLALSHRPKLLILDEPMSGLDAIVRREVHSELLEVVQDEDRSVLISSHNLDEIERYADHIGILSAGRMIVEGTTQAVLERFQLLDVISHNGLAKSPPRGVRVLQRNGERLRILLDTAQTHPDAIARDGVDDVVRVALTLEDLFVALSA